MALYYSDARTEDGDEIRIERGDIVTLATGCDFDGRRAYVLRTQGGLVDLEVTIDCGFGERQFGIVCSPESLVLNDE